MRRCLTWAQKTFFRPRSQPHKNHRSIVFTCSTHKTLSLLTPYQPPSTFSSTFMKTPFGSHAFFALTYASLS